MATSSSTARPVLGSVEPDGAGATAAGCVVGLGELDRLEDVGAELTAAARTVTVPCMNG